MSVVFTLLGILIGCYTVHAALRGELHAKSGVRWRLVTRAKTPFYFWTVVVIYGGLSVALMTLF